MNAASDVTGFTMVELIVGLVLLGLIAGLGVIGIATAGREATTEEDVMANARRSAAITGAPVVVGSDSMRVLVLPDGRTISNDRIVLAQP